MSVRRRERNGMGRSRRSRPNLAPRDAVFARRTARRFGNATGSSWTLSLMQMIEFTSSFDKGCRDLLWIRGVEYTPAASSS